MYLEIRSDIMNTAMKNEVLLVEIDRWRALNPSFSNPHIGAHNKQCLPSENVTCNYKWPRRLCIIVRIGRFNRLRSFGI